MLASCVESCSSGLGARNEGIYGIEADLGRE